MPSFHRLIKRHRWFFLVRHEVVQPVAAILAVGVGVQRGQQRRATLYAHAQVQRATLAAVAHPGKELGVAEPLLRLGYGAPADAAQHQLVPHLF